MKYSLKIVASDMQMGMHECIMLPHGDTQSLKGSYTTARHILIYLLRELSTADSTVCLLAGPLGTPLA